MGRDSTKPQKIECADLSYSIYTKHAGNEKPE
jgi:hypothetical protein